MAEIKLENVRKKYGSNVVLDNFSVTVKDGECFSILGPSPSGKTTILRAICGFEKLDEGEISIGNKVVTSREKRIFTSPEKRNIGMVFQDYAVWPHMTAFGNVYYPLKKQKMDKMKGKEKAEEALKMVKLGEYKQRLPSQLSGGQQQRIAIARSLVTSKEIILLDEPLCNLDANLREEMRFEIKELQRKIGTTIILVTHDQDDALAISDRIAIMDKTGKIRQLGSPEYLYKNPVDSYVFKFLGLSNFIPLRKENDKISIFNQKYPYEVSDNIANKDFFAAVRPKDIEIKKSGDIKGIVKRIIFLGSIYEYRVQLGSIELRIHEDSCAALKDGLFKVNDECGINFTNIKYYNEVEEI